MNQNVIILLLLLLCAAYVSYTMVLYNKQPAPESKVSSVGVTYQASSADYTIWGIWK